MGLRMVRNSGMLGIVGEEDGERKATSDSSGKIPLNAVLIKLLKMD